MIAASAHALDLGWPELGTFLLANAIVFWICFPKVWQDIRRWRAGS
jgi:hypothetical protein